MRSSWTDHGFAGLGAAVGLALCLFAATANTAHGSGKLEKATDNVRLQVEELDGEVRVQLHNLRPVASEIEIRDRRADGQATPEFRILPPLGVLTVFTFADMDRATALATVRERHVLRSTMGDPAQIHPDEDHQYRLPFAAGRSYRLSQGFHGRESHQGEASAYALDFQMEVGDAVHAARAGRVVRAVDWFSAQVSDRARIDEVNLVVIEHADGTLAHYVHLDHQAVFVREGDPVGRGQHIANAGLTGFTRGPHLHFVVRRERDRSIPIRFEGYADRDLSRRGRFVLRVDGS